MTSSRRRPSASSLVVLFFGLLILAPSSLLAFPKKLSTRRAYQVIAKIAVELRGANMPSSFMTLMTRPGKATSNDVSRATVELLGLSPAQVSALYKLMELEGYAGQAAQEAHLLGALTSREQSKQLLVGLLKNEEIPIHGRVLPSASPEKKLEFVADTLGRLANLSNSEIVMRKLRAFEEAALDIVLDSTVFFEEVNPPVRKEHAKYIGNQIAKSAFRRDSPFVRNGEYAKRVREAIRYQDISDGSISADDEQLISHQHELLYLLNRLEQYSGSPNLSPWSYWKGLSVHPRFRLVPYHIALANGEMERADEMLPMLADVFYSALDESLLLFATKIHTVLEAQFDGRLASQAFLAKKENQLPLSNGIGSKEFDVPRPPEDLIFLSGPTVVVINRFEELPGGEKKISYLVFDRAQVVRKEMTVNPSQEVKDLDFVERELARWMARFNEFIQRYQDYRSQRMQ